MRADKMATLVELHNDKRTIPQYVNKLRYERLMAKARELKNEALYNDAITDKRYNQCYRISEAYEARARRIKEGA